MKPAGPEDTRFELSSFERLLAARPRHRWLGWRANLLVLAALVGCLALFVLLRVLSSAPTISVLWVADANGRVVLTASQDAALQLHVGSGLAGLSAEGRALKVDAGLLERSPRWVVDDAARAELVARRSALARALASPRVTLLFDDGAAATVKPGPRGLAGLPLGFWLLIAIAIGVYLVGAVVMMARPAGPNLLYALMTSAQAASLAAYAVDTVTGLGATPLASIDTLPWRALLDLSTCAAAVHAFALQPRRLARHRAIAIGAWLSVLLAGMAALWGWPGAAWWGVQGGTVALGLVAVAVLNHSYRQEPNPLAVILRRISLVALATLSLVLAAATLADRMDPSALAATAAAGAVWTVFFASLLVLVPFMSQTRQLLREFALLAGLSTVATTLDLVFVSVFSLGQFTSLTLAVFLGLAAYASARQWVFSQLLGKTLVATERTFERLYRIARELQTHPQRYEALFSQLLRELFDPVELLTTPRPCSRARVVADGAALVVPLHALRMDEPAPSAAVLRFAHGGKRVFTVDDARLADRLAEQLQRAVMYDRAVERGRAEERMRIAQDLHDDIGARLLTLMYKAESPEVEEYVRHTLQDLKTLTRGLAASEHKLAHAVAEWKADIQQRLEAAGIELGWRFDHDADPTLSVVQWSGLTRVLRELVSNTIHHAQATQVGIQGRLHEGTLRLTVRDDGLGRDPQQWSHGLGLGGVRKRVKLLGGTVAWRERKRRGIACEVTIPLPPPPA